MISAACKLIYRINSTALFFAYADPMAGEYGGVYQAANWIYLGQGIDGTRSRAHRYFVLPPGADWNNPADWKTTRELRRGGRRLIFSDLVMVLNAREAKQHEKAWRLAQRDAKHVYATNVGSDRRGWARRIAHRIVVPYPAPQPELKRKQPTETRFVS